LTAAAEPVDADAPEITIVLADDHAVVRNGLRLLLEAEEDMEVVAEAGDVEAAQRFVLGHKPTVLVLDLNMPGGSSLEAIPRIAEISPHTKVVVLTMQEDPAFAREALRTGPAATCSSTPPEPSSCRRSGRPPAAAPGSTPTSAHAWLRRPRAPSAR
jgi:DNA-binding NarL/FixJ family response regulator